MVPEFFSAQDLDFEQVKCVTHALMAVARVDGVHDNEMRMIREFYEGCARAGDPPLETVAAGDFDPARARSLFSTPEKAKLFVKSLILLAYADGTYGKAEDAKIRECARAVGLSSDDVDRLHEATKEYLLTGLSHVQNLEALKDVQRRLEAK